jgi:hypothetical protein
MLSVRPYVHMDGWVDVHLRLHSCSDSFIIGRCLVNMNILASETGTRQIQHKIQNGDFLEDDCTGFH